MKHNKNITLSIFHFTLAVAGLMAMVVSIPNQAQAGIFDRANFEKNWVGHHLLSVKDWAAGLTDDQKQDAHLYLNYEDREPCQNYRPAPQGLYVQKCHLHDSPDQSNHLGEVFRTYTIFFDLNSDRLTKKSQKTLRQIASEITTYNPKHVTVMGHTDRAGAAAYNDALSKRRADKTSDFMSALGVNNRVIDKAAFGEKQLAVPTKDGVVEAKNRRVVIQFRR